MPVPLTNARRTQLIRAREARGLTQTDVARAVGMSSQYINRIERGAKAPSRVALTEIANVVGLEVRVELRVTLRPKRPHRKQRRATS